MTKLEGHCLCGAVTIVTRDAEAEASACHCAMCRRWTGAAQWGFRAPASETTVTGPVRTFRSSSFAERAWCGECGTHLWLRDDGADYEFVPGLFDGARQMPLSREVYADRAFACVRLAGDHPRITRAEYEATERHVGRDA